MMTAMKMKVYNQSGKESGAVDLADSVFALPWNADLVYQVVTSEMANRHRGIAHAKGRGEVRVAAENHGVRREPEELATAQSVLPYGKAEVLRTARLRIKILKKG